MTLSAPQQGVLSRADPAAVATQFGHIARNWQRNRWLPTNNRYATDCVVKIGQDLAAGGIRNGDLSSYIAASSALHCVDGWSYLSRALQSELAGDQDAARHLAYYAELRAAMSLLASVGIGVFKNKHFALKSDNKCERVTGSLGTHEFVWEALEYWSQLPSATDAVLDLIRPGGRPLAEWLTHFPPTAGGAFRSVLARHWLRQWGLDLQRIALDQVARNESSYRPTGIGSRRPPTIKQSLAFIEGVWRVSEPSSTNSFGVLDRYLLRRSLAMAFKNHHPRNLLPENDVPEFERLVEPMFHGMMRTVGELTERQWRRFLSASQPIKESELILQAESRDPVTSSVHHFQVISRATILLRIATGSTLAILRGVGAPNMGHLGFWWRSIGEGRGLWELGVAPPPFLDLWTDVDNSLDRLRAWKRAGGKSKKGMFTSISEVVQSLSSCERIALWGLGA